jgi:hypothetical protein
MQTLAELRAREQEVEREWLWLQDALENVARARPARPRPRRSASCSTRPMAVGQRCVELRLQRAALEGQPR